MRPDPATAFQRNMELLERACSQGRAAKPLRRTLRFVRIVRSQIQRIRKAGKALPDAEQRVAALLTRANRAVTSARLEVGA